MNFFMVSRFGEGAHLLYRIMEEGNEVNLLIWEKSCRDYWDGILPKAASLHEIEENSVVLFDMSGLGAEADALRRSGHLVTGASSFADRLEKDRKFGFSVMERSGISIPKARAFGNFQAAREFIRAADERYVFKPDDAPARLTYCAEDVEDMLGYLDFVESLKIKSFTLQEFKEGALVSSELWFDGRRFLRSGNHTVEKKKFLNGDLGSSTGCMGNLVWLGDDEIFDEGVARVEELLVDDYVGPIDLNTIVNDDGVWGLEWTPRFGYDAMPTLLQLIEGEIGEFFSNFVRGQMKELPLKDEFAAGVRLSIPPFPSEPELKDIQELAPNLGVPIRGLPMKFASNYYFYEIKAEEDHFIHPSGGGSVMVASDHDSDAREAFKLPYEILEGARIPEKQYRTDLEGELLKMYDEVYERISAYA